MFWFFYGSPDSWIFILFSSFKPTLNPFHCLVVLPRKKRPDFPGNLFSKRQKSFFFHLTKFLRLLKMMVPFHPTIVFFWNFWSKVLNFRTFQIFGVLFNARFVKMDFTTAKGPLFGKRVKALLDSVVNCVLFVCPNSQA